MLQRNRTSLERLGIPERPSPRVCEVLTLAAQGHDTDQIAAALGIARRTVKNHLAKAYDILDASNRTEAVVKALRQGYISVEGLAAPPRKASDQ